MRKRSVLFLNGTFPQCTPFPQSLCPKNITRNSENSFCSITGSPSSTKVTESVLGHPENSNFFGWREATTGNTPEFTGTQERSQEFPRGRTIFQIHPSSSPELIPSRIFQLSRYWLLDSVLQAGVTVVLLQNLGKHFILCLVFLTFKILSGTHVRTGHWKCVSSVQVIPSLDSTFSGYQPWPPGHVGVIFRSCQQLY